MPKTTFCTVTRYTKFNSFTEILQKLDIKKTSLQRLTLHDASAVCACVDHKWHVTKRTHFELQQSLVTIRKLSNQKEILMAMTKNVNPDANTKTPSQRKARLW